MIDWIVTDRIVKKTLLDDKDVVLTSYTIQLRNALENEIS